jgi:isopropylmalate/homocitrate/citramalate synthase
MHTDQNLQKYDRVVGELREIYARKNRDYGDSFNDSLDEFGIVAYAVRASDKMQRIKQLLASNKQHVKDEPIKDTIRDLANYSIMAIMWLEGKDDQT